jgi:hypothetical protein
MMRNYFLFACVFGAALLLHSQSSPTAASTPTSHLPSSPAVKPVTFHSDLLNLTFAYPPTLVAQTLPSLEQQHADIAAKQPADETPESRKTDGCTDKALLALRQDDPKRLKPTVTVKGDKQGAAVSDAHAVTAKILISRTGVDCMPASYRDQLDNVATAMSSALAQDHDLQPIDQPIWYDLGTARIHFAASETPSNPNQAPANSARKPEQRWVGSAAFVWAGNMISIVIESNDQPFFNEMLHSKVGLGTQTAAPLFPAEIGHGTPIQPKSDSTNDQP